MLNLGLKTRDRNIGLCRAITIEACLWSVVAAAYLGILLTEPAGVYDEGQILCGAARILHGQLPYRDFNTGYPPGQFYTIAGVFSLFGTSLLAERIWDTVWRLAILGLAIVLARASTPWQRPHPLPLICIGLFMGVCSVRPSHLSPTVSGMLPCLVAVLCAVFYLNQRGLRWLFLSGIAAGFAVLYRHDLAACVCVAVTIASSYQAMTGGKPRWLQFPAVFWAGVLPVVAVPVLYFWLSVPHDVLVESFIDFPRAISPGRHLPLNGPSSLLAWCNFYLPLTIIVAAAFTVRQAAVEHRPTLVMLLTISLSTLAVALQRLDMPHAYPAIIFSLLLLSACIAEWQHENRKLIRALLLSGAILCYGVVPLFIWSWRMMGMKEAVPAGIALREARYSRNEAANEIVRAGPVRIAFDERQAIVYIQEHLLPGKSLYVGVATHGLGWYNDALFYFLADRPNATRFDMFAPGITTSAAVQTEMLRDIDQKHTEYVVIFRLPPSREANLSSVDSGVSILDDAIQQDYVKVAEFGRYTIWHRKNL